MEIINYIMGALFVLFMVFLVLGFNKQMQEKSKQREKNKNTSKDYKKNR